MKTMMNDEGLLECPFCNEISVGIATDEEGWQYIECSDCYCRTDAFRNIKLMTERWNTRNGHLHTADDYKQDAMEREHGL